MILMKPFHKYLILSALILTLSGCASLSNMFGGDDPEDEPRLKGERISIMELESGLEADSDASPQTYAPPSEWTNDFWPQQGGYPNHAMHNPALGPSPLGKLWRESIGRGSTKRIPLNSMPIVMDDMIYALNTNLQVTALSLEGGKERWVTNIDPENESDIVIGGGIAGARGKLFVTNGYTEVLRLDGQTGEIDWRVKIPSAARAAPSILSGRVFVQTLNNQLIALSASNGDLLWTHQTISESSGLLGAPSPAVNRDIVVPGYSSGELFALRLENGGVSWQDNLSPQNRLGGVTALSDIQAMPVLDRGLVFAVSFGGRLVVIDQRTGRRIWQRDIGSSQTPWIAGESLFVLSSQNRLVSFDRTSGQINWVKDMPKFEAESNGQTPLILYGPVMAGSRLFISSSDGTVFEINPKNGEYYFTWTAGQDLAGAPIVASETLFLLSESGNILAFRS